MKQENKKADTFTAKKSWTTLLIGFALIFALILGITGTYSYLKTGSESGLFNRFYSEKNLGDEDISFDEIPARTYNASAYEPDVVVNWTLRKGLEGEKTIQLRKDVDFEISYKDNLNAGTATATVTGLGNFKGAADVAFEILPRPLVIRANDASVKYNQEAVGNGFAASETGSVPTENSDQAPVVALGDITAPTESNFGKIPGFAPGEGIEVLDASGVQYSFKHENLEDDYVKGDPATDQNTKTPVYYVQVSGITSDNYDITFEPGILNVMPVPASDIIIDDLADVVYSAQAYTPSGNADGSDKQSPKLNVYMMDGSNKVALVQNTDYVITGYEKNTNAGQAAVKITFQGNYTGNATKNFNIVKAPLNVVADDVTVEYGNAAVFSFHVDGLLGSDTLEGSVTGKPAYECAYTISSPAGDYPITISAGTLKSDNYDLKFVNGTCTCITIYVDVEGINYRGTVSDGESFRGGLNVYLEGQKLDRSEYTVKYALSEAGPYELTTIPPFSEVGEHVVYFLISKDGFTDTPGCFTVTLENTKVTYDADDGQFEYGNVAYVHQASAKVYDGPLSSTEVNEPYAYSRGFLVSGWFTEPKEGRQVKSGFYVPGTGYEFGYNQDPARAPYWYPTKVGYYYTADVDHDNPYATGLTPERWSLSYSSNTEGWKLASEEPVPVIPEYTIYAHWEEGISFSYADVVYTMIPGESFTSNDLDWTMDRNGDWEITFKKPGSYNFAFETINDHLFASNKTPFENVGIVGSTDGALLTYHSSPIMSASITIQ